MKDFYAENLIWHLKISILHILIENHVPMVVIVNLGMLETNSENASEWIQFNVSKNLKLSVTLFIKKYHVKFLYMCMCVCFFFHIQNLLVKKIQTLTMNNASYRITLYIVVVSDYVSAKKASLKIRMENVFYLQIQSRFEMWILSIIELSIF